jgi:tetratricopeptide (TPR) repeat protein/DNA-binding CsgD family transcriptional regulator
MAEDGVQFSLPVEFYETHLRTINNVKFRRREIDIVAFMLNGRSGKKTASFLSLSPKTVENYTHNIMLRLECNSREAIIDFIEKSGQLKNIRNYYSILLALDYFESKLKQLDVALGKEKKVSVALYCQNSQRHQFLLEEIQKHLKILGINTVLEILEREQPFWEAVAKSQDRSYLIYAVPSTGDAAVSPTMNQLAESTEKGGQAKGVFFLFLEGEASGKLPTGEIGADSLRLPDYKNYCLFFFDILKRLLPDINLETTVEDFNIKTRTLFDPSGAFSRGSPEPETLVPANPFVGAVNLLKQRKWLASSLVLACLCSVAGYQFARGGNPEGSGSAAKLSVQPDLPIPTDSMLLGRSALVSQIHRKFQEKPDSIQTIALFGIGGAGKTTVARQYARQEKGVVWEINAETRDSLRESFENLAYALAKTDADKNILMGLKDIREVKEKDRKLLFFVREKLKSCPGWLLIFDNVEKTNDIQHYFPSNPAAWGRGRVIVTTRNSNIAAYSLIHCAMPVGELTPEEKLSLFERITNNGKGLAGEQKQQTESFLKSIPSFPLDISVAAHYLKSINIPYEEYVKSISTNTAQFDLIQSNVLNEVGAYSKTRYGIITLSLREIIKESKDFGDILLFMSLLDSQNIPIELLDKFKDPVMRDSFVHHLKKYSLISNAQFSSIPCLCIHRSTQDITFAYLGRELNIDKGSPLPEKAFYAVDDYVEQAIEKEDLVRMGLSARHVESLLRHQDSFPELARGALQSKLGCIYYFMNDHARSQKAFDEALPVLDKLMNEKAYAGKVAGSLLHIGNIATETGDYAKAQKLFEQALNLYNLESARNDPGAAWALSCLGNVYRRQGHFEKAKEFLEESIRTQRMHGGDALRMARTLSYIGTAYRWLGDYEKSAHAFEESLETYQRNLPTNHFRIGWVYAFLGHLYKTLGKFEESKGFFEKSLTIYQANFAEDHVNVGLMYAYLGNAHRKLKQDKEAVSLLEKGRAIYKKQPKKHQERIAWIAFNLGKAYEGLKDDKKAKDYFEESLAIYKVEHERKGDIEKAEFLRRMGEIYLFTGQLDEAESVLVQSLEILERKKHAHTYESLEALANLYEKRYRHALSTGNQKGSEALKEKFLSYLGKTLKVMEACHLEKSPHFESIQNKIRELEKR